MKRLMFCFFLAIMLLGNCKPEHDNNPTYTFKGQIIDATTNKTPVGLPITLEASSGPNSQNFKTEILGTATTDSMGKFTITYKRTELFILRLLSQFYTHTNLPINQNVDTIFYISSKGTLAFVLTADTPLKKEDTLYLAIPPFESGKGGNILKLPGPFSYKEFFTYKTITSRAVLQYFWAIGHKQWDSVMRYSHKYPKNKLIYFMRGDPFIDTVKIKYR